MSSLNWKQIYWSWSCCRIRSCQFVVRQNLSSKALLTFFIWCRALTEMHKIHPILKIVLKGFCHRICIFQKNPVTSPKSLDVYTSEKGTFLRYLRKDFEFLKSLIPLNLSSSQILFCPIFSLANQFKNVLFYCPFLAVNSAVMCPALNFCSWNCVNCV